MSNWNEKSLEDLIFESLQQNGYLAGHSAGFNREFGVDWAQLLAFLEATQSTQLAAWQSEGGANWQDKLLRQLFDRIGKQSMVGVLRDGLKCGASRFDLFYPFADESTPATAQARWKSNIFSVTRQLHFSQSAAGLSLDLAVFINGIPVATLELKNAHTGQRAEDAMRQYRDGRDPKEPIFAFGRCLVHFAGDAEEAWMTSHLRAKDTIFLPFNKGTTGDANSSGGNPPNPNGLKTSYLWEDVLTPRGLAEIVEKFAQLVEEESEDKKKTHKLIFPRFHQRDAVRKLVWHASQNGAGQKYLIQHSAGSGKSNTIAWLCHQLAALEKNESALFDSIILVTDRRVLDRQIAATLKQFAHARGLIVHADKGSFQLRGALQSGKRIIISTIQKFPEILKDIGGLSQTRFAIVIDEAHSSQGGKIAGDVTKALSGGKTELDDAKEFEDKINELIASRKMLPNASYFAFTATPKNKTLETFGVLQPDGTYQPFHVYSMKQAIEEGFILDVLKGYTTYSTFYTLFKKIDADPEFDKAKANKRLRTMVEKSPEAIGQKAAIMIEHFHTTVARLLNNNAKAMIVTSGIEKALRTKWAFDEILNERGLPYRAIVAFSGEKEVDGQTYTESGINGFDSGLIPKEFKKLQNKFLIVAEKFQTGFDEPLLTAMYVDKPLAGVQAVQTLSRLNRCFAPLKTQTFILDFANKTETIQAAFDDFYKTTILTEETDLNRLNQLQDDIEKVQLFSPEAAHDWVARFLNEEPRETLEPSLDEIVKIYREELDANTQIKFKGDLKSFCRAYEFLNAIRPFRRADWEVLAVYGRMLLPKLPAPGDDDGAAGVLEATGLSSYRVVRNEVQTQIELSGEGEIEPAQIPGGGLKAEAELDTLSQIVKDFNTRYGKDATASQEKFIVEELPAALAANPAYQAAKEHSDVQGAIGSASETIISEFQKRVFSETDLFKKFSQDKEFQMWLITSLFHADYQTQNKPLEPPASP